MDRQKKIKGHLEKPRARLLGSLILIILMLSAGCKGRSEQKSQLVAPQSPAATITGTNDSNFSPAVPALPEFTRPRVQQEFPAYVELLKQHALQQGITPSIVEAAFSKVHFVSHTIAADRGQLEKKITLDDYLKRVLPASKVQQTRQKFKQNHSQLVAAGRRYDVDEHYLAALWGIESSFGKLQGKKDIISSMATLAFEGRREAFFVKELMAALQILQQGYIDREQLLGSWAGAMGQCQFMPSSYLKYGVDSTGKGQIDIWNNKDDVFASMANYLLSEGWQSGGRWGDEVILPTSFPAELAGLDRQQARSIAEWQKLGIRRLHTGTALVDTQSAWIILPDDRQGRAFMVYDNFHTLMRWNRSIYFAISVGMLADAIALA